MGWNNPLEYPFTAHAIRENAPDTSGVYALCEGDKWIHIGDAEDLQKKLLEHLSPDSASYIVDPMPTTFSFELLPADKASERAQELRRELKPVL